MMTPRREAHGRPRSALAKLVGLGVILSLCLPCQIDAQGPEKQLELVRKQMRKLRHERALKGVSEVLAKDSGNLEAWLLKAEIHLRMSDHEAALQSYKEASKVAPGDPDVLIRLGDLLRRDSTRLNEAIGAYRAVLKFDPEHIAAMVSLGSLHERQEEWDLAEQMYRSALRIDPNHVRALSSLGAVQFKRGQYEEASSSLRKAIELSPRDLRSKVFLGLAQNHMGYYDRALEVFKEALQIDPHAANQLIGVREQQGQFLDLIPVFRNAYEEAPREAGRSYDLAVIYFYAEDYESAWTFLIRAENLRYPIPLQFKEVVYSRRRLASP